MKFSEIASRLNGVSTPIFGVSWTPPTADVEVVRGVLAFSAGRRVIQEAERCNRVVRGSSGRDLNIVQRIDRSVHETRTFLTEVLVRGGTSQELTGTLELMRSACLDYLNALEDAEDSHGRLQRSNGADEEESVAGVENLLAHTALYQEVMAKYMGDLRQAYKL